MDADNVVRLTTIVSALCEAFGRTPSDATFMAYQIGLQDLPIEAIERAGLSALRSCNFMPSPAELRELAGVVGGKDRAVLAWEVVLRHLHLGPYRHVDFDDWLINGTIRNLGGWVTFIGRFTDPEAEKWLRKEFCDTYAALHRCGVDGESCRPLAGLAEVSVVDGALVPPIPVKVATGLPRIAGAASHARLQQRSQPSASGLLKLKTVPETVNGGTQP
jgi:hypothetical protein